MSEIILEKITMNNFMGSKEVKLSFSDKMNLAYGENGTGKSRMEDAFNWVLFGKNAAGQASFDIQNTKDVEMNKVDHEVTLHLQHNKMPVVLRRILRAKVSKEGTITGYDTILYRNDTHYKVGEYKNMVDTMIREDVFKMLTNVFYFNSNNLVSPTKRREILIHLVGGFLSDAEIASGNEDYENLLNRLSMENKSLDDFKKQTKDQITALNKSKDDNEAEINALLRNMPEDKDWASIENQISEKKNLIAEIDELINSKSEILNKATKERQQKQLELHGLQTKINQIKFQVETEVQNEINAKKSSSQVVTKDSIIRALENEKLSLSNHQQRLENLINESANIQSKIDGLISKWADENAKSMPSIDENCPTCKQSLPDGDIQAKKDEIARNWNQRLLDVKADIEAEGKRLNQDLVEKNIQVENQKTLISSIETKIIDINQQLSSFVEPEQLSFNKEQMVQDALDKHIDYNQLKVNVASLNEELSKPISIDESSKEEVEVKKAEKRVLQSDIDILNQELGVKVTIIKNRNRIQELEKQNKEWTSKLNELEKAQKTIISFNRAKISSLEERINAKFEHVSFKMFNVLLNGEVEDICETVYDGKTYSSLNTASKINAGLDIINTLSEHYGIKAPIFIDNSESVTKFIPVKSQSIHMIVSADDKVLRIV